MNTRCVLVCALSVLPLAALAAEPKPHVRVVHAPAEAGASAGDGGMIVYTDPDTGELRATPPPGVRAVEFPELQFDPAAITEEHRADGTVITWLNGAGIEAQVLHTDSTGKSLVACSSVLESARRAPDLRKATTGGHGDVR